MSAPSSNSTDSLDTTLIAAVASGDRRALATLYFNYHRRLARFLGRFTQSYENIEEVLNDTFLVVWQSAPDFRHASRVSTWIMGIAYRTALKSLRRQQQHRGTSPSDTLPDPSSDPTHAMETRDWIEQGLRLLSLEHRLTLELAYHFGHSVEEIAAITAVPVGTVKARMFHARENLRRRLAALSGHAAQSG
jgi:RNA polymerase sigma-70 factor (ECF subfamily)